MNMRIIYSIFVGILLCNVGYAQQTLGGFGAGGLNGAGFGDPVANDYAGIDWGYDFQAGMIMSGYNPYMAKQYADSMMRQNMMRYANPYGRNNQHPMQKFREFRRDLNQQYPFLK